MNISVGLGLKGIGGALTSLSCIVGSLYLKYVDSLTAWDNGLLEKISDISSEEETAVAPTTATAKPKIKLDIKTSEDTSNSTTTFEFKFTNENDVAQEISWGMKSWECKLKGSGLSGKTEEIKKSFGIEGESTTRKFNLSHKRSMYMLIISCAKYGNPWRPDALNAKENGGSDNDKLTREVNIDEKKLNINRFYYPNSK